MAENDTNRTAPNTDPREKGDLTTEDLARPEHRPEQRSDHRPDRPDQHPDRRPDEGVEPERSRAAYPGEAVSVPKKGTEEPDADEAEETEVTETVETSGEPLIAGEEAESFRTRWESVQGTFVDDPKDAVREADALVAEVIQSLAATFADHKKELEAQWSRGEPVETEGLRMALQQYRTFFNQLLHA
ncbi:hypothetical protein [Streptomyces sp. V3I7]|uniref:hypothetical protein n=1 Tax=Streptomyces sp. V3I7 TaxID=3042278 RepID=UPI002784736F|nr:hypothetical protein [Streptomyces sp. V3I7]MDQ0993788.1 hypothetical protein [Streptomyces sp. V3I7]